MEEKITAWIARDKEGGLYIHTIEPNKEKDFWIGLGDNLVINRHLFPQVKWEDDEPTKVELTIKICENVSESELDKETQYYLDSDVLD